MPLTTERRHDRAHHRAPPSRKPLRRGRARAGAARRSASVAFQDLRRDVFPDLSAPVFNVIVQNAAMGAEELETARRHPAWRWRSPACPSVRRIRSTSQLGVAQVTVEFEPDADYYRARQLVAERVAQVARELPPGTDAPLSRASPAGSTRSSSSRSRPSRARPT